MKTHIITCLAVIATAISAYAANECDQSTRLLDALSRYEFLTGKHVEVSEDLQRHASKVAPYLRPYYYSYNKADDIENTLKQANIGLFTISDDRVIATWVKPNFETAREYLEKCKRSNSAPPIHIWIRDLGEYQEKVPELKLLREQFNIKDQAWHDVLLQNEEYRTAKEEHEINSKKYMEAMLLQLSREEVIKQKSMINASRKKMLEARDMSRVILKDDPTLIKANIERSHALIEFNIRALEFLINDFEEQGKFIPVNWIKTRP